MTKAIGATGDQPKPSGEQVAKTIGASGHQTHRGNFSKELFGFSFWLSFLKCCMASKIFALGVDIGDRAEKLKIKSHHHLRRITMAELN